MTAAASPAIEALIEEIADMEALDPAFYQAPDQKQQEAFVTEAKHPTDEPGTPPVPPAPHAARGRAPKPPEDVPWAHQPGCTNPVSDDWGCACGPEVIKA